MTEEIPPSSKSTPRPDYDPELEASLQIAGVYVLDFEPGNLASVREGVREWALAGRTALEDAGILIEDLTVTAHDGAEITYHHVRQAASPAPRPCIVYVHGGGMVIGSPWDSAIEYRRWVEEFGASVVTVDYRLVPEVIAPSPVEDCYAVLSDVHKRASELGIDPDGIVIAGLSAGGGLAAGTAILARERGGPPLCGQLLMAPMLDPRAEGDSTRQVPDGPWNREENRAAWALTLGPDGVAAAGANAPACVESLAGLPPALLEVGSAEIFRTEVVDYATRIWREGGDAELHVWSGGFHGFQSYTHATVTQGVLDSRRNWLSRRLGRALQGTTAPRDHQPTPT